MNTRRNLLIIIGAAATSRALRAQTTRQPVLIGWLAFGTRESAARSVAAFKEGLAAHGWKEGSQIVIEERWADGHDDRLTSLAQELAAKQPALIVAQNLRAASHAAKAAPKTPIVMVAGIDPVAVGLVANLARPGGMITGLSGFEVDLAGKYLELLLAAAPKIKRVGVLADSGNPSHAQLLEVARRTAALYSLEAIFQATFASSSPRSSSWC